MSDDRFKKLWEVREFKSRVHFEDELNEYVANSYGLHSWKIVPLGSIVAVFVKMQNAPEKPQGIRAR